MTNYLPRFGHSTDRAQMKIADLDGAALVIHPTSIKPMQTAIGAHEAVVADLYILDGDNANAVERDYLFFNSLITDALKDVLATGMGVTVTRIKQGRMVSDGRSARYLTPINLLTDKELLVQAEVVATAQGWM